MTTEKDIVSFEVDFVNRRITVKSIDNNPELLATKHIKFALISPVGLILQGLRKWLFGSITADYMEEWHG